MAQAVDTTVRSLREQIVSGRIAPGSRLGEADLAEQLHVSRTPVREALSRLAAEGLVELVPHRGARVASWTEAEIAAIFDLRLQLEPHAVALGVPVLTDADCDELEELARAMSRLGRPGRGQDLDALVDLNRRFHDRFLDAAHSAPLAAAVRTVTHLAVVRRNFRDYDAGSLFRSLQHHHELVAAARARVPEWAAAVMRSHLHNARSTMVRPEGATP